MKLTIGMPHYDDFDGAWFTVQALRMFHAEVMDVCEIVIIDNHPESQHGKELKKFVTDWASKRVRYIPYADAVGTAAAKDRLFREAIGEAVLCIDCHVLIEPGAIAKLIQYYDDHPETRDLLTGPLVYDDLTGIGSHFDDVWRGEMWGTWGMDKRGADPDADPFEIGAQGGGLMTCRKAAWLGFNPHFRGFGGEEWYIHEKVRKAGAKCVCLPFLRWVHRFYRAHGVPYRLAREDKVRNYILGHREMGLSLDRARAHFVEEIDNPMSQAQWDQIVAKVDALEQPAAPAPCSGCGGKRQSNGRVSLGELFDAACNTPSDINEHCTKLRELASQCRHVTEFGMRPLASTVALLAGQPARLVTYAATDAQKEQLIDVATRGSDMETLVIRGTSLDVDIDGTDLLFIDTRHTAEQLTQELERHAEQVRRWIVLHDTVTYGTKGEDGGPGLLPALRTFMRAKPEWSVIYHAQANHGLTVISRDPADKPELPSTLAMAGTFAKALTEHVQDGVKKVDGETLEGRLAVCTMCTHRIVDRCSVCGCRIMRKAAWRSSECPLGMWPPVAEGASATALASSLSAIGAGPRISLPPSETDYGRRKRIGIYGGVSPISQT